MNLTNLDLNQLFALDALLEERSVTKAAQRLGYSQPSLSASLSKLRRQFRDDLLIRDGNRYTLSPLALRLREQVSGVLSGIQRLYETEAEFDVAESHREFTIAASDYAVAVLGSAVTEILEQVAPNVRLRFEYISTPAVDNASEFLRMKDGMLIPHGFISSGVRYRDLFRDSWVIVAAADNPKIGDEVTLQHLADLPWVMTYHSATAFTPAARQLSMIGIEPNVQMVVESFLALPYLIAGTGRIGLMQGHLAGRLPDVATLRIYPCPYEVLPLVEALWWHPMYDHDPGHLWLRSVLEEAGASLKQSLVV